MSESSGRENTSQMRRGPSPLALNIGLAIAEYKFLAAQNETGPDKLEAMLTGIRKYHNHAYFRVIPDYEEIWSAGEARLLRHKGYKKGKAILLVPSVINGSAILDLMPERSFLEYLKSQGFDPVLLDWGRPIDDDDMCDMNSVVSKRLIPALDFMNAYHGGPVHTLGYCMGGVLLVAAVCANPAMADKIVLLGTPWDFHASGAMLNYVAAGTPAALQAMADRGHLPMAWIQSVFAAMNASRAAEKFAAFAAEKQDSSKARLFVAVEDWLNNGVDLPAPLARACIAEWYGENRPMHAAWVVDGRTVDINNLENSVLVVAGEQDRLVPPESALAIVKNLRHPHTITPALGHIGMMAGGQAKDDIWKPVAQWLA